jgi:stage IV sporulation protein FB
LKITIHPLFIAVIIFCAFYGGFLLTIIMVLTALLHECGHIFCASKLGYKCERIKLMPYGASAVCNIDGISIRDEIAVAMAGPLVNIFLCVAVAGLWWFFPETYAYTDTIMFASASMLVVNLLPAYPLDGGRIIRCALIKFFGEKPASITLRVASIAVSIAMVALFFILKYNITCLFFALFLACSAVEKDQNCVKINFSCAEKLKRGMEIKYVAVGKDLTYKDAIKFLDDRHYVILQLYDDTLTDEITQDELLENLQTHTIYSPVFNTSLL